jgi:polyisoprenoid-binding protein YceI
MSLLRFAIAFALAGLSACDDPAEDAPAARTAEPSTAEPSTAEPSTAEPTAAEPTAEPGQPAAEALSFSQADSKIEFVASKVTASHEGSFGEFAGTVRLDPSDLTRTEVQVQIAAASITADDERLTEHLKSPDFFDVAQYPTATFRTTRIVAGGEGDATHTITGDLTMHGQTKEVTFPATLALTDAAFNARAEFSIDRNEWGITYPGMQDDLIRDRVVIKLDLHANRAS